MRQAGQYLYSPFTDEKTETCLRNRASNGLSGPGPRGSDALSSLDSRAAGPPWQKELVVQC